MKDNKVARVNAAHSENWLLPYPPHRKSRCSAPCVSKDKYGKLRRLHTAAIPTSANYV